MRPSHGRHARIDAGLWPSEPLRIAEPGLWAAREPLWLAGWHTATQSLAGPHAFLWGPRRWWKRIPDPVQGLAQSCPGLAWGWSVCDDGAPGPDPEGPPPAWPPDQSLPCRVCFPAGTSRLQSLRGPSKGRAVPDPMGPGRCHVPASVSHTLAENPTRPLHCLRVRHMAAGVALSRGPVAHRDPSQETGPPRPHHPPPCFSRLLHFMRAPGLHGVFPQPTV